MSDALKRLATFVYHERQQPGSMLCGMHALNSLLQGPYFSAADLSDIAGQLDTLERHVDNDNRGASSTNVDDTGFFSIQVLENALQVWGLTLVRWRSEEMKPFQEHPETQLGFILNLDQHWYTLRRFGIASLDPSLEANPEYGVWFNLDSNLNKPERIGTTHLGMVLIQAESENYSVFAIVQSQPDTELALPRTKADEIAASLSLPASASQNSAELEDEDMELQAALQASLIDNNDPLDASASTSVRFSPPVIPSAHTDPYENSSGVRTPTGRTRPGHSVLSGSNLYPEGMEEEPVSRYAAPIDPVEASRQRNEALMQRFRREQEIAMRETHWEEESRVRAGLQPRRQRRQTEDEEMERAIAASVAEARERGINVDDAPSSARSGPQSAPPPPATYGETHRVYDDDDPELQAALRASLETAGPGEFQPPSPPRQPSVPLAVPAQASSPPSAQPPATLARTESEDFDTESEAESNAPAGSAPAVDMEEMRRRRLARFGG